MKNILASIYWNVISLIGFALAVLWPTLIFYWVVIEPH